MAMAVREVDPIGVAAFDAPTQAWLARRRAQHDQLARALPRDGRSVSARGVFAGLDDFAREALLADLAARGLIERLPRARGACERIRWARP